MAKKKGGLKARLSKPAASGPKGTQLGSNKPVNVPHALTPFKPPTSPPSGYFDPALDAEERASQRGLFDLTQDVGTQNLQSRNDFDFGLGQIGTQRARGAEDYGRSVAELDRSYANLATRQAETARASGNRGGAVAQGLRKRMANEAFDRAPIDTNFKRSNENLDTQQGRLGVEFQRDWDQRNLVTLPRAQREAGEFGLDTNAQRWFQSKQAGYDPPVAPPVRKKRPQARTPTAPKIKVPKQGPFGAWG